MITSVVSASQITCSEPGHMWDVKDSSGKNEQTESGTRALFKCDLVLYNRIWLHGDWERAAWRLLSFLSVRDGNTHCLWG